MRKRNFVVFYTAIYQENTFFGHEAFQTDNGDFISWAAFRREMIDEMGYDDVAITSIIELTTKDYNTWTSDE